MTVPGTPGAVPLSESYWTHNWSMRALHWLP